jgi:flavin reductase (DIM6/NTAB) family NADH-FMN oxidoreductase RutF
LFYESHLRDKALLPHDPFKALIAPRPVGWVSTMNKAGEINLAPYSFFNAFSGTPPLIGFSSDGVKDSLTFAQETGEFVWNLATWELRDHMNDTSAPLARGHSEFVHAGLEMADSRLVRPPRVKASPAQLECKVTEIVHLKNKDGGFSNNWLVMGEVVGVWIDDGYIKDGIVQVTRMKPIARCGYQDYTVLDEVFQMRRPKGAGNAEAGG